VAGDQACPGHSLSGHAGKLETLSELEELAVFLDAEFDE
jgi:hypothetical protein